MAWMTSSTTSSAAPVGRRPAKAWVPGTGRSASAHLGSGVIVDSKGYIRYEPARGRESGPHPRAV